MYETNETLCAAYQAGDSASGARLVENNSRLIRKLVWNYSRYITAAAITQDDLYQEGVIALLRAAQTYDPGRGYRFITYVWPYIRRDIRRAVLKSGSALRLPDKAPACAGRLRRIMTEHPAAGTQELLELYNRGIARRDRLSETSMKKILRFVIAPTMSLDATVPNTDITFGAALPDTGRSTEAIAEALAERQRLCRTMETALTDKERRVVILRYGLDGGSERTLAEISRALRISRERARQLKCSAMKKLRHEYPYNPCADVV